MHNLIIAFTITCTGYLLIYWLKHLKEKRLNRDYNEGYNWAYKHLNHYYLNKEEFIKHGSKGIFGESKSFCKGVDQAITDYCTVKAGQLYRQINTIT